MTEPALDQSHNSPPTTAPMSGAVEPGKALVRGRLIEWDPATGLPVPVSRPILAAQQIEALATTALSLPYEPEEPAATDFTTKQAYDAAREKWEKERSDYAGMTCAEVMMVRLAQRAADGNQSATSELLDRVLGRPKQTSEVKSVSMKYEDYMKKIADEEAKRKATVIDATVEPSPPGSSPAPPEEFPGLNDIRDLL